MRKLINKKLEKKLEGKCIICNLEIYEILDVHRIEHGKDGGKYTKANTIVSCANCHRKIHSGKIKILGKYLSTAGKYIIHLIDEGGKEIWK